MVSGMQPSCPKLLCMLGEECALAGTCWCCFPGNMLAQILISIASSFSAVFKFVHLSANRGKVALRNKDVLFFCLSSLQRSCRGMQPWSIWEHLGSDIHALVVVGSYGLGTHVVPFPQLMWECSTACVLFFSQELVVHLGEVLRAVQLIIQPLLCHCRKPPLDAALEHLGATSNAGDSGTSDDPEAGSIQAVSMEWGEQGYLKYGIVSWPFCNCLLTFLRLASFDAPPLLHA
eukprot:1161193-Pelagomonas_calceolata.AAC.7